MFFRPLPILTFMSVLSVVLLILLGNWQYDRYQEKLSAADATADDVVETRDLEATFLTGQDVPVQQVYGLIDGEPVWRRYAPATVPGSPGWVLALQGITGGPTAYQAMVSEGPDVYKGLAVLRSPESYARSTFANRDQPEQNLWYSMDLDGMADRFGRETRPEGVLEPLQITIRKGGTRDQQRVTKNPYAFETPPDPLPPERHFGYALTWWGMAIALIGVYLAFHHARGRLRVRS